MTILILNWINVVLKCIYFGVFSTLFLYGCKINEVDLRKKQRIRFVTMLLLVGYISWAGQFLKPGHEWKNILIYIGCTYDLNPILLSLIMKRVVNKYLQTLGRYENRKQSKTYWFWTILLTLWSLSGVIIAPIEGMYYAKQISAHTVKIAGYLQVSITILVLLMWMMLLLRVKTVVSTQQYLFAESKSFAKGGKEKKKKNRGGGDRSKRKKIYIYNFCLFLSPSPSFLLKKKKIKKKR
ncbi:hypothetical protein RFI_18256 [Reticulomyxa filosa]|uniref:Uncharacterized protein n=1 Tax=Reticulomyxa filosa TaxID=46433 RepID=X6MZT3_RETFI|nr:hypothetical protein RFI_18256 [Reticulomyxa filosa]|eukprot:ETO18984.1 hypothetical protein RFI_18256 [Reticulomyxa filosa]